MRVVLDTNVLISGVFWGGIPSRILDKWIQDDYELIVSQEVLEEYARVLNEISKGKRDDLVARWLLLIAEYSHIIEPAKTFKLSRDPDDNKFIECAVSGQAEYLVSGDLHLLEIGTVMNTKIVSPSVFVRSIAGPSY